MAFLVRAGLLHWGKTGRPNKLPHGLMAHLELPGIPRMLPTRLDSAQAEARVILFQAFQPFASYSLRVPVWDWKLVQRWRTVAIFPAL